jgi:hypothetical protein
MGSKTMQRSPAFPPVLTSYKLREIERADLPKIQTLTPLKSQKRDVIVASLCPEAPLPEAAARNEQRPYFVIENEGARARSRRVTPCTSSRCCGAPPMPERAVMMLTLAGA